MFCQNDLWNWFHRTSEESDLDDEYHRYNTNEGEDDDEAGNPEGSEASASDDYGHHDALLRAERPAGSERETPLNYGSLDATENTASGPDHVLSDHRQPESNSDDVATFEGSGRHLRSSRANISTIAVDGAQARRASMAQLHHRHSLRREQENRRAARAEQRRLETGEDILEVSDDYNTDDTLSDLRSEVPDTLDRALHSETFLPLRTRRQESSRPRTQRGDRARRSAAAEPSSVGSEVVVGRMSARHDTGSVSSMRANPSIINNDISRDPPAGPSAARGAPLMPAEATSSRIDAHPNWSNRTCPQCRARVTDRPLQIYLIRDVTRLLGASKTGQRETSIERENHRDQITDPTWGGLFASAER